MGIVVAWRLKDQRKTDFLASNRTQTAIPLALNFIASGEWMACTAPATESDR
jgi:hypothetical protein